MHCEQMASAAFVVGLGYARWDPACPKFLACSWMSSAHFNKLSSNGFGSRSMSVTSRRHAAVYCTSHEAEMLTSVPAQLNNYCFLLLSPSILVSLLVLSAELRRRLVEISVSKRSIVSEVIKFLGSAQWQELRRCAVQISAVLVLANAFYSDIAPPDPYDTLENVPQDISGGEKRKRIQRPKSKKAERCTQKCLGTCIKGGAGSPGEGPFNIRKPLVVFKEGFRTRQYCLIECSEICNLIGDGDDGP